MSNPAKPERPAGDLEVVRLFVNTRDVHSGDEDLGTAEAVSAWLRETGLPADGITAADVPRMHEVREALRKLLLANSGEPLDPVAVETLRAAGRRAPLAIAFDEQGHTALEPAGTGADAAIAALLAIVARAQVEGTWQRLKACLADPCQWAFYDQSRNRSRHWCSMSVCGNRAKVRSYRERTAS